MSDLSKRFSYIYCSKLRVYPEPGVYVLAVHDYKSCKPSRCIIFTNIFHTFNVHSIVIGIELPVGIENLLSTHMNIFLYSVFHDICMSHVLEKLDEERFTLKFVYSTISSPKTWIDAKGTSMARYHVYLRSDFY